MIEVLHYWLNNTLSGCTWDKLANAVERMGGESKVVENLRARQELNGMSLYFWGFYPTHAKPTKIVENLSAKQKLNAASRFI